MDEGLILGASVPQWRRFYEAIDEESWKVPSGGPRGVGLPWLRGDPLVCGGGAGSMEGGLWNGHSRSHERAL